MKCVDRGTLDYTGDDYTVPLSFIVVILYYYCGSGYLMIRSLMMVKLESFLITLSYGTGGLYLIWIHPPTPPRGSGRGPQTGYGKNQDSRALLSLARAKIPPPESCLSLVYRGFLGGFWGYLLGIFSCCS